MEDIKIKIPEGYEIDKEKSVIDLEKCVVDIKLKKKTERWRDNKNARVNGFWIDQDAKVHNVLSNLYTPSNHNIFATEKQAKSSIAMARISQIMANDERFGGTITDEEWMNVVMEKYTITRRYAEIICFEYCSMYHFLAFHTREQRELFLKENEDLVKDYLMLD